MERRQFMMAILGSASQKKIRLKIFFNKCVRESITRCFKPPKQVCKTISFSFFRRTTLFKTNFDNSIFDQITLDLEAFHIFKSISKQHFTTNLKYYLCESLYLKFIAHEKYITVKYS